MPLAARAEAKLAAVTVTPKPTEEDYLTEKYYYFWLSDSDKRIRSHRNGLRWIQASGTWDGEGRHGDGDGALHDREDEGLRGGGRGGEDHQAGDNQLKTSDFSTDSDWLRWSKEGNTQGI